jgi:ferredoxin/flavodoxin
MAAMKTAAIVYHSGTGGTRTIAELLALLIVPSCEVRLIEAGHGASGAGLNADILVFGYPTFYLKPTPTILDFVATLPRFTTPRPAFVFTTLALYAENSLRRFTAVLREKNVYVFGSAEIKSPASDGSLTLPEGFAPSFYRFERRTAAKISAMAQSVIRALDGGVPHRRIPRVKWYTPLAQVMQVLYFNRFERMRFYLRAEADRCTRCGRCVIACPRRAWRAPFDHSGDACDLCLRCVHHCPRRAIGWDRSMIDKRRLTPALHWELKTRLVRMTGVVKQ